ncbi:Mo-dependent nitrogenase C-terminal domain-containing protein [Spirulina sp. CS-785/01]|uniref:Mo-dependent nitrogenase C-terminal domain-containing protein n=1 Tax=Spirulina sp. CS-785/01 TaxID=3021716 RepID=UPI00232B83CB|nr:Mo-dependent nitrogenase C-terminal domain-containing protein [Spirulina sp. CS-785/01]MDB9315155.1 Mo-dependent nitrogenase C-terminal domain-containing protein [Spirulina sp. CS-785/01]
MQTNINLYKTFSARIEFNIFSTIRQQLDNMDISNPDKARFIVQFIPAQCPFARDIALFGKTLFTIPPLCKVNPFYEQFMMLRFRALSYLADECGEDISAYC